MLGRCVPGGAGTWPYFCICSGRSITTITQFLAYRARFHQVVKFPDFVAFLLKQVFRIAFIATVPGGKQVPAVVAENNHYTIKRAGFSNGSGDFIADRIHILAAQSLDVIPANFCNWWFSSARGAWLNARTLICLPTESGSFRKQQRTWACSRVRGLS